MTAEPVSVPRRPRRRAWVIVGGVATALVLVGLLVVVAALSFAVTVTGDSMQPTLHTGDRLFLNVFARNDVKRFDLVQGRLGHNNLEVVKRVIGLPGDRISIEGGSAPIVYVQPADSTQRYRVENTTWPGRIGDRVQPCCRDDGTRLDGGLPARTITVPGDQYWVIGDNWGASDDSRIYGFLAKSAVQSVLSFRVLPLKSFGTLPAPAKLVPVP